MRSPIYYLTAILLMNFISVPAQEKDLYDFGKEIFETLKSDKPEDILNFSKETDIDNNALILETFLNTREKLENISPLSEFKYFNTVEGVHDKLYILLKNNKKYYVIKTTLGSDNSIAGSFQLIKGNLDDQLALGEKVYKSKCFACHSLEGRGSMAPNLTDSYWKYVNSEEELYDVIANGKKGTMMMAYKNFLSPEELQAVFTYLKTLIGKKSKYGKKPEGEKKNIHFKIF
jgi:mono/diheme cytochrome c family protein